MLHTPPVLFRLRLLRPQKAEMLPNIQRIQPTPVRILVVGVLDGAFAPERVRPARILPRVILPCPFAADLRTPAVVSRPVRYGPSGMAEG